MWAGAVAEPLRRMSAGRDSTISMSKSVAVSLSALLPASNITLERMGMVLRRSTTLCTWERALRNAPRSTLIFIGFDFRLFGRGVPFRLKAPFSGRAVFPRGMPGKPHFSCVLEQVLVAQGGPKTQVGNHSKRGTKGQKKRRQN